MSDRFSDWKKYVEQETGKADQQKFKPEKSAPSRQVPEIDRDKFRIHRNIPAEQGQTGRPLAGQPVAKPQPVPSPFVSVKQAWEPAQREPARPRPALPPREQELPGIKKVPPPPVFTTDGRKKPLEIKGQSREEILERLVNPTITLEEAAKIMGVCKATVRRYTAKGALPHYRTPGNQRRFKLNDIIAFLEEQKR